MWGNEIIKTTWWCTANGQWGSFSWKLFISLKSVSGQILPWKPPKASKNETEHEKNLAWFYRWILRRAFLSQWIFRPRWKSLRAKFWHWMITLFLDKLPGNRFYNDFADLVDKRAQIIFPGKHWSRVSAERKSLEPWIIYRSIVHFENRFFLRIHTKAQQQK